jgi:hypothetical protein
MDYKTITGVFKPKKYSIEDFIYLNEETIKEETWDFDFYKEKFGNKLDDEFMALFELIENSDLSKKEVKLMSMMFKKMYEEKYKEKVQQFHLKPEEIKPEDFKSDFIKVEDHDNLKSELVIEDVQHTESIGEDVKEIKVYNKQNEFNEDNYKDFYEIAKKMKEMELNESS